MPIGVIRSESEYNTYTDRVKYNPSVEKWKKTFTDWYSRKEENS